MNKSFWLGKRVFITGHTGFKGGWLSLWLQKLGANVTGYALEPSSSPSIFKLANIDHGMHSHIGDIRNYDELKLVMQEANPEILIHMAAQALVRPSYKNPIETYSTNVMGTVHTLEAARNCNAIKAIIVVTSDKCYENQESLWGYRESDPMGGYDPYSNSKGCAELVASAYRSSFFNNKNSNTPSLATARAGNVIGGGDWSTDRLIPDIFNAFSSRNKLLIRNPNAIRPWQHVLEPLYGYLVLAESLFMHGDQFAEAWNFGPNDVDTKKVDWIVRKISSLWGGENSWVIDRAEQPHEAKYLKLDISKSRARLNWTPQLSLEDALSLITSWEKARISGRPCRDLILSTIEFYENLLINTQLNVD